MNPEMRIRPGANEADPVDQQAADTSDSTVNDAVSAAHLAAERAFAGGLVLCADPIAHAALELCGPQCLADPFARTVVTACSQMLAAELPRDEVTVADYLERHRMVPTGHRAARLYSSLHELADSCPVPANTRWYADIVARNSMVRSGIETAGRLARVLHGGVDDDHLKRIVCALSYAEVAR